MKNIIDMLDALRAKLNCPSDMALAKAMGISRQAVSQWRLGMGMSDAQAARIAELLGVDVILALLFGAASRSDGEPIRQHWLEAARLREYTLCEVKSAEDMERIPPKYQPRNDQAEAFGEIPVSEYDIAAWLLAVPRIAPGSPRAQRYIAGWNVPEKIRAAKRAREFEAMVRGVTPSSDDAKAVADCLEKMRCTSGGFPLYSIARVPPQNYTQKTPLSKCKTATLDRGQP